MSADNFMQQVADEAQEDRYNDPPEMPDKDMGEDPFGGRTDLGVLSEIMDDYETLEVVKRWMDTDNPF